MKKTPDGKREVVEMLVPIEGSTSRTVRITGMGLPPKIGVGAVDLPDSTWIEITNRSLKGSLRYDTVETVRGGMMPLHERPLQGDDQAFSARSGASFGEGKRPQPDAQDGETVLVEPGEGPGPTMSWIVTDARGQYLFVAPAGFNSSDLVDAMAKSMHGEFTVEMISAGTLTAGEKAVAPGWRLLLDPPVHPGQEGSPKLH